MMSTRALEVQALQFCRVPPIMEKRDHPSSSVPCGGEVRAMSTEQCWSLAPNASRCPHRAVPGSHFCEAHNRPNRHPLSVWRATEAETPPDLVAAIRAFCPEFGFLAPAAPSLADASPSAPAAKEGSGRLAPAAAVPAGPVLASEAQAAGAYPTPLTGSAVAPCQRGETDTPAMDWFLNLLQEAMTGVMAGEATPLQKANAIARLGGLYLKAGRAAELERTQKELEARVADLEARLAAAKAGNGDAPVPGAAERPTRLRQRSTARPSLVDVADRPSPLSLDTRDAPDEAHAPAPETRPLAAAAGAARGSP